MRNGVISITCIAIPCGNPSYRGAAGFPTVAASLSRESFEFQMLLGVREKLQRDLAGEGYRVRVYVPYGEFWYPYLMRRIGERPANGLFLLKNLLR